MQDRGDLIQLLNDMKIEHKSLNDNVDSQECPEDCWCKTLPLHLFPEIISLVRRFSSRGEINVRTPRTIQKSKRKRSRMPDSERRKRKLKAVQEHRRRIADTINASEANLKELKKESQRLDQENERLLQWKQQLEIILDAVQRRVAASTHSHRAYS